MKAAEGLTEFSVKKNERPKKRQGKEDQWDWLGEYCIRAILSKNFAHPGLDIKNSYVEPSLEKKMDEALKEKGFRLHDNARFKAITISPRQQRGRYEGLEVIVEIDWRNKVGEILLSYLTQITREAFCKALDLPP